MKKHDPAVQPGAKGLSSRALRTFFRIASAWGGGDRALSSGERPVTRQKTIRPAKTTLELV